MADKGIIFSAPMVRALLDGRKTQTRRLLNPQPVQHVPDMAFTWGKFTGLWPDDWFGRGNAIDEALPYAPGDRLYVREGLYCPNDAAWWYRADDAPLEMARTDPRVPQMVAWQHRKEQNYTPSIHMPRWASRLWLLVTDVRVQRVAEISSSDALAEGIDPRAHVLERFHGEWNGAGECVRSDETRTYVPAFQDLWNSLHTKPGERWEDNPWIVAVSFTVHHGNIDKINHEGAGAANNRSGGIQR